MKLECKKINKRFGANPALVDVDLTIEGGEIRALLGGNGSGKSTLSKIIGGALSVTSGTMEFNGKPYAPASTIAAKRAGVIFTSQELSLFDNVTVEENIALCNYSIEKKRSINKAETYRKVHELLGKYGLERLARKQVGKLDANEQYLVEFMKSLYQEPEVLIIDEITSALFDDDVKVVKKIMHEYKDKGKAILFISHRMPEILDICDTVTVLRNGYVVDTHLVSEVSEEQLLTEMTGLDLSETVAAAEKRHEGPDLTETLMEIRDLKLEQFGTHINLDVKKGEIIGIAGLQGMGQSDFVRTLFGLIPNQQTEVILKEKDLMIRRPEDAIKNGISFISGNRTTEGVFEERSIEENLGFVSRVLFKEKIDADPVLKRFGVKYFNKKNRIVSLSGGNQQKVVLARWLHNKPLVVLADDPTKGIDVQARRDVHRTLVEIAEGGSAVLMVSSDSDELVNLASLTTNAKVIVMYEGEIVNTLRGDDVTPENIAKASVNMLKEGGE